MCGLRNAGSAERRKNAGGPEERRAEKKSGRMPRREEIGRTPRREEIGRKIGEKSQRFRDFGYSFNIISNEFNIIFI